MSEPIKTDSAMVILKALFSNPHINLGDLTYNVREREGKGWDGPSVVAWSKAVTAAQNLLDEAEGQVGAEEPDTPETLAVEIQRLQHRANKAVRLAKLKGDEFHPLNVIDLGLFGLMCQAKNAAGMFPKAEDIEKEEGLDDKREG